MGAMQVTMIDENKYAETMTDVVLPALEQCCEEGWFDPSAAERSAGIEPLSGIMDTGGRSGQLHYLCYDSAKFDAIREQGATATFRGAIVISHASPSSPKSTTSSSGTSCLPATRCVYSSIAATASPRATWTTAAWCGLMTGSATWPIWPLRRNHRPAVRGRHAAEPVLPFDGRRHRRGRVGAIPHPVRQSGALCPDDRPRHRHAAGRARVLVGALCGLGFGKKRVFGQSDFTPEFSMEGNEGASEARERWYFKLRCENSEYQTYCAAFEWVRQALKLNRAILNPSACAEVETPVLLFQSGRDIWVLNKPQNHFVQLVKDGGGEANIVRFPESRHEIFSMPNSTYKPYLEKILGFYDDPMIACAAY